MLRADTDLNSIRRESKTLTQHSILRTSVSPHHLYYVVGRNARLVCFVLCSGVCHQAPVFSPVRCCVGARFHLGGGEGGGRGATPLPGPCDVEPLYSAFASIRQPAPQPVQRQRPPDIHTAVVQQHAALLTVLTAQYIKVRSDTQVAYHAELPRVWAGPYWMGNKPTQHPIDMKITLRLKWPCLGVCVHLRQPAGPRRPAPRCHHTPLIWGGT